MNRFFFSCFAGLVALFLFLIFSAKNTFSYPFEPLELEEELSKIKVKEGFAGINMVFIKGGCFEMGDNFGNGDSDEKPVHTVCVNDFNLSETEVTQEQWKEVTGSNPPSFKDPDRPVGKVSWNDVQEFLNGLNAKTGKNYRLPTEAEWEYAAREGGKNVKYANGKNELSHDDANYSGTGGKDRWMSETSPVKSFPPNSLGLYDMAGNVWEWCTDWYDNNYYSGSPKNNPKGPLTGNTHILRGGSWRIENPRNFSSAHRGGFNPDLRDDDGGFRLAQ